MKKRMLVVFAVIVIAALFWQPVIAQSDPRSGYPVGPESGYPIETPEPKDQPAPPPIVIETPEPTSTPENILPFITITPTPNFVDDSPIDPTTPSSILVPPIDETLPTPIPAPKPVIIIWFRQLVIWVTSIFE